MDTAVASSTTSAAGVAVTVTSAPSTTVVGSAANGGATLLSPASSSTQLNSAADSAAQMEPLRQALQDAVSDSSKSQITEMVSTVEGLNKLERLLLYLQLPATHMQSDPLRQPINPLGSRTEIQLTITWIKTHLEEDPQVSLPKHEVYDEYIEYCNVNNLKALSTADFGKVMKQVYPQVRPRRLGTRGNSRYCYAGLKKKVKLEEPCTPECIPTRDSTGGGSVSNSDHLEDAARALILEWVDKLFSERISSYRGLALFLIDKMYVDTQSAAAQALAASVAREHEVIDGDLNLKHIEGGDLDANKRKLLKGESCFSEEVKRKKLDSSPAAVVQLAYAQTKDEKDGAAAAAANAASFIDEEMNAYFPADSLEGDSVAHREKLSQLRQLLEKNLKPPGAGSGTTAAPGGSSAFRPTALLPLSEDGEHDDKLPAAIAVTVDRRQNWDSAPPGIADNQASYQISSRDGGAAMGLEGPAQAVGVGVGQLQKDVIVGSSVDVAAAAASEADRVGGGGNGDVLNGAGNTSLSNRRRVSFNPLVVHDNAVPDVAGGAAIQTQPQNTGNSGIQPSPGTRKRHFSFQPISPRQGSLPQSPNASPFISPRSTPVPPIMRSRHSSGSALPLHLLPGSAGGAGVGVVGGGGGGQGMQTKLNFGSSGSDVSRAATFGSASECSTPFISPHGTPIPFNRSRHNSAQGRLCSRSRHSSGLGPYRYNNTFSPMALNNLNNPYSPQPSTPVACGGPEDHFPMGPGCPGVTLMPPVNCVPGVGQAVGGHVPVTTSSGNGGGTVISSQQYQSLLVQFQDNRRSRHSSAESEPAMRSGLAAALAFNDARSAGGRFDEPLSSTAGHVAADHHASNRQRHASAGHVGLLSTTLSSSTGAPPNILSRDNWYDAPPSAASGAGDGGGMALFSSDHDMIPEEPATREDGPNGGPNGGGGGGGPGPDDLDMAISALKDCDNDFDKMFQENEQEDKK